MNPFHARWRQRTAALVCSICSFPSSARPAMKMKPPPGECSPDGGDSRGHHRTEHPSLRAGCALEHVANSLRVGANLPSRPPANPTVRPTIRIRWHAAKRPRLCACCVSKSPSARRPWPPGCRRRRRWFSWASCPVAAAPVLPAFSPGFFDISHHSWVEQQTGNRKARFAR